MILALRSPAPFERRAPSGVIDENSTHNLCADRKEMHAVVPSHIASIHEAYIGFVYQRRSLHRVPGLLPAHIPSGEAMQLVIYKGCEPVEGGTIAPCPGLKQDGDIGGSG